jgi:pimeloyl-ACP methyl ester carboxylesterase
VAARHVPGLGAALGWAAGHRAVRRNGFVFGDAFADRSLLDGEFDELFLQPLHRDRARREAAMRVLRSFDHGHIRDLVDVHRRIDVPVQLIWGERDVFFPVERARQMVGTFPDATLAVIEGAGLFSHEERPAEVASAMLPALVRRLA